jgi:hypothetical protein
MYFPAIKTTFSMPKDFKFSLMGSVRIFLKVSLLSNTKAANSYTAQCARWVPPAFCPADGSMYGAVTCQTVIQQNNANSKYSGPKSLAFKLFNFSMRNYKDLLCG